MILITLGVNVQMSLMGKITFICCITYNVTFRGIQIASISLNRFQLYYVSDVPLKPVINQTAVFDNQL